MSYTIPATEIKPGMTITEEHRGVTRTLTVDRVDRRDNYVTTFSIEGGTVCIVNESPVTVEGDRPASAYAVGTVLRVPGVGSIVKVSDTGFIQWVDADGGGRVAPSAVDRFDGVSVVYEPVSDDDDDNDDEVTKVPDVVESHGDWEPNNTEWRKHKWEDIDGDVWEWDEVGSMWLVVNTDGTIEFTSDKCLFAASFPLSRVK